MEVLYRCCCGLDVHESFYHRLCSATGRAQATKAHSPFRFHHGLLSIWVREKSSGLWCYLPNDATARRARYSSDFRHNSRAVKIAIRVETTLLLRTTTVAVARKVIE